MDSNISELARPRRRPLVLSHRGSALEYPQNTLLAFHKSLDHGAEGIELDVQLTADSVPVIAHDDNLYNLTGKRIVISESTQAELACISFAFDQKIPTLEEVLQQFAGKTRLLLEFKRQSAVEPAARLIAAYGSWGINTCSFDPAAVLASRMLMPAVPCYLNTGSLNWKPKGLWREHFPERAARECQACGVSCYQRFVNHRQVRAAKVTGGPLLTWSSLYDEKHGVEWVRRVLDFNPDVVITARPKAMLELLHSYYGDGGRVHAESRLAQASAVR